jgi:hypothetical protein
MAFDNYESLDAVIEKYKVRCVSGTVEIPFAQAPPFNEYFLNELAFNLQQFPLDRSKNGWGELLIFPILREVWKPYYAELRLFSHEPLEFDADLTGIPNYFVCKQSEFGPFYPTVPYLLVMEAKLDDFGKAWGQCLAAMLAAQKLHTTPDKPVYGITTNGRSWEFGELLGNEFTRDPNPIALHNLDSLRQALHAMIRACRDITHHYVPTPGNP